MATTPTERSRPDPLWAVLLFTGLNSLGSGVVTNGIYFIADEAYNFTRRENFLLGVAFGLAYIAGAALVGPALKMLDERLDWLTPRRLLIGLMLAIGLTTASPAILAAAGGDPAPPRWSIWLVALVYSPLSGALWPIVESYLSGGRRGVALRRAVGLFNICWAAAVASAFCGITPLFEQRPLDAFLAVAAIQALTLPVLAAFSRAPARHLEDAHEPHPPVYRDLLIVFRWLLPTGYVIVSILGPYLPSALERVGVATRWETPFASAWMIGRVATFIVFERWHGWHGRWYVPIAALTGLLVSFGVCVLAPAAGGAGAGLLVAGLACLGASLGVIYVGSLYYAMEVGSAEVEAGGMHESLIGIGYTAGPALGVGVSYALGASSPGFEPTLLGVTLLIAMGVSGYAVHQAARRSKHRPIVGSTAP